MQAKPRDTQRELYSLRLHFICKETLPLIRLSNVIDWFQFYKTFGKLYCERVKLKSLYPSMQN